MSQPGGPPDIDYRFLLDTFADAVVATTEAGRIVYVNAAAEKLLGWPAGDLMGRPLTTIMPERMRARHLAGFRRYVETHEPHIIGRPIRVPALRHDGSELEIEVTLSALRPLGGGDLIVASLRDLRDRVELERKLAVSEYAHAASALATRLAERLELAHVLSTATRALVADFGAGWAEVWLEDPRTGELAVRASAGAVPAGSPSEREEVARTRRPLLHAGQA